MTTITRRLIDNDYDISDADVKELCETKLASGEVDKSLNDGYFRVLFKRTQMGTALPTVSNRLQALEEADARLYPIVLEVVNSLDECAPNDSDSAEIKKVKAQKRNERTNYARSAKSTIKAAIMGGIEIETKQVGDLGKTALAKETREKLPDRDLREAALSVIHVLERKMAALYHADPSEYKALAQYLCNYYK